ncbi:MAG: spore germination protein [Clostridia bacterium]|nr:spore germination protein [Clostridia bacterium]
MKEFTRDFTTNREWLVRQFERAATFRARKVINAHDPNLDICVFYFDSMVNGDRLNRDVITALRREKIPQTEQSLAHRVAAGALYAGTQEFSEQTEKAAVQIASGDCVILVGNCPTAIILDIKGMAARGIEQPDGEESVTGSHEGFNENIINDMGLIKKRLSSPNLKAEIIQLGRQSHTAVCMMYLEGVVRSDTVERIRRKVSNISIDGVWDANYVMEMIVGSSLLFPLVGKTQRPDVAADKLCEGRVVLIVNGSPTVLALPFLFTENFQTADDYYLNRPYGNVGRVLRLVGFFLAVSVPAFYIAMLMHHPSLLPPELLFSIAEAGREVPMSMLVELIALILVFEILRETGSRMPQAVGLALNIVGAIVLGQSAVEAGFVSAPMVIVVAFSGTLGLMVRELRGTVFFLRLGLVAAAAGWGLFGIAGTMLVLWCYLHSLCSFGVEYMYTFSPLYLRAAQDVFFRGKIRFMNFRQKKFSHNRKRQGRV